MYFCKSGLCLVCLVCLFPTCNSQCAIYIYFYVHFFSLFMQLVPFWPLSDDNRMVVTVGNDENTVIFNYRKPNTMCLRFENEVRMYTPTTPAPSTPDLGNSLPMLASYKTRSIPLCWCHFVV